MSTAQNHSFVEAMVAVIEQMLIACITPEQL